jgi:phosphatidylserine decarboxylase
MDPIYVIDRQTGKKIEEKVFGGGALKTLYGSVFAKPLVHFISRIPLVSSLYGFWQNQFFTKRNILPFIETYHVDASEFRIPVNEFRSFNDFFIRKLKPECRPIDSGTNTAIMPADGRYRFFQDISAVDGFVVKGEKFNITTLLGDEKLSQRYARAAMVMARLCPVDYHRFHFPVNSVAGPCRLINGYLYSVNPIAVRQNIHIFTQNKRVITELDSPEFGKVLFIEIGATNVGTINQTYEANFTYQKGDEKGYFSFGASALIVLFEPGRITFDPDLVAQSEFEILCKMGTRMGICGV